MVVIGSAPDGQKVVLNGTEKLALEDGSLDHWCLASAIANVTPRAPGVFLEETYDDAVETNANWSSVNSPDSIDFRNGCSVIRVPADAGQIFRGRMLATTEIPAGDFTCMAKVVGATSEGANQALRAHLAVIAQGTVATPTQIFTVGCGNANQVRVLEYSDYDTEDTQHFSAPGWNQTTANWLYPTITYESSTGELRFYWSRNGAIQKFAVSVAGPTGGMISRGYLCSAGATPTVPVDMAVDWFRIFDSITLDTGKT